MRQVGDQNRLTQRLVRGCRVRLVGRVLASVVAAECRVERLECRLCFALGWTDRNQLVGRLRERDGQRPDGQRGQRQQSARPSRVLPASGQADPAGEAAEASEHEQAARPAKVPHQQQERERAYARPDQVEEVGLVHRPSELLQRDRDRQARKQERNDQVRVVQEQEEVLAAIRVDIERVQRAVGQNRERPDQRNPEQ